MAKVRRPAKAVSLSEAGEVRVLTDWLDVRGIGYIPIPNRGRWHGGQDNKRRGAPDLVLTQCRAHGMALAPVAIEMKRADAKPSDTKPEQLALHDEMRNGGWIVLVCRGADDAIARLKALGF